MLTKEEMPACPVATTVQLIGSKWKLLILKYLLNKTMRYNELKREIDKNVVREENYKGEFYEISPYSYQRNRFKQGKIVGNVTSLKTTNNLFTYYFDVKNQIIEIREGLELKNQFYYLFHL